MKLPYICAVSWFGIACGPPATDNALEQPDSPGNERVAPTVSAVVSERADHAQVGRMVEEFGRRLARVSLQAPPDIVQRDMQTAYGDLVAPELLARWIANPAAAPGRAVSSPYPNRIEISSIRRTAREYEVHGDVVYVTSRELTSGGAADRKKIVLLVARGPAGTWNITSVTGPPR
jgi:hypothetical protein